MAIGTTLISGLATNVSAEENSELTAGSNPFSMNELDSGYMQLSKADAKKGAKKMQEGACGEGQCGANMMPKGALEKTAEGKCAGNKPMPGVKKGVKKSLEKDMEGKCGEGRCGSNM